MNWPCDFMYSSLDPLLNSSQSFTADRCLCMLACCDICSKCATRAGVFAPHPLCSHSAHPSSLHCAPFPSSAHCSDLLLALLPHHPHSFCLTLHYWLRSTRNTTTRICFAFWESRIGQRGVQIRAGSLTKNVGIGILGRGTSKSESSSPDLANTFTHPFPIDCVQPSSLQSSRSKWGNCTSSLARGGIQLGSSRGRPRPSNTQ